MDNLWAPWRIDYILSEKEKGCIFCNKPKENKDLDNLILYRGKKSFVIMNRYPYNSGHLMVVPFRHIMHFEKLEDKELLEINKLLKFSINAITGGTDAQGEVTVKIEEGSKTAIGRGSDPDIIVASAKAYINALNRLARKQEEKIWARV
jgi:hypothetical protein